MIKLANGKWKHYPKHLEYAIWAVFNGDEKGTEQQQAFVSNVEAVWLDRTAKDCPISYLVAKANVIAAVEATEPIVGTYATMLGVRG